MRSRLSVPAVVLCVSAALSGCASPSIKAQYACTGGKTVSAAFVNGTSSRVKLALSDGRTLTVPQAVSASGARYANADESFVFWNKGNTAFIQENGKMTYGDCVARP